MTHRVVIVGGGFGGLNAARQLRRARVSVTLVDRQNIYVIGDLACFLQDDAPLPGTAPVAIQQGRHVAKQIRQRLRGRETAAFRFKDHGQMATIGRAAAVCDLGRLRFGGLPAWIAWLLLHLILLVGFQNRLLVLMQWCWNYLTRNRSARLITHGDSLLVDAQQPSRTSDAQEP